MPPDMKGDASTGLERLWGDGHVRVFISHTSAHRWAATRIQEHLRGYGVATFVSHIDIEPMAEWELEIRRALLSAHALVALLTPDFPQSDWTDQEVGVTIGRGIPVIPVRLGHDPYGFIAKYQAISGSLADWPSVDRVAYDIFSAMLETEGIKESMKNMYVNAVRNSPNWITSNALAQFLPSIRSLTSAQAQTLVEAYNLNGEVSGSFGFKGSQRHGFSGGLAQHLTRITGEEYRLFPGPGGGVMLGSTRELDALWPFGPPEPSVR
ncbi:MAG: toll/interleukin-1 receptor domain-containing protein [Chloroflexota bacterium]|nr:toll/interleukin-1 receptor domain-containing protein [Chloroflexota bacterium]